MGARRKRSKVVLHRDSASELVNLIRDEPGEADEELLDEALEAVQQADSRLSPDDHERIDEGDAVAIEMDPPTLDAVETLIVDDEPTRMRRLSRLGDRLRSKVRKARDRSG